MLQPRAVIPGVQTLSFAGETGSRGVYSEGRIVADALARGSVYGAQAMSESTVQIRRYPNRRLYDRSRGQYVTLKDIEDLVLEGKTVEVSDSRTGEDMTRQILTQILMDRYPQKMEMFPVAMLHSILRANDFALDLWRGYLRQSLAAMETWQKAAVPFTTPVDWVSAFFPTMAPTAAQTQPPTPTVSPAPPPEPPGDPLAARLDELSRRLERLESGERRPPVASTDTPLDRLEERLHDLEGRPRPKGGQGRRTRSNGR